MSDWDSILACHRNEVKATTWNLQRCNMGKYHFIHARFDELKYKDVSCTVRRECITLSLLKNLHNTLILHPHS